METPAHQEWRSRQRISVQALVWSALVAGAITFIFSGGTPWTTSGSMNGIMGRSFKVSFAWLGAVHFALAFLYAGALARATYRLTIFPAVAAGVLTGVVLYAINGAVFHALPHPGDTPETRVLITHVCFALFGTVVYKGASVPKPRRSADNAATAAASAARDAAEPSFDESENTSESRARRD